MFSLWRKARRENSAASRLLGTTSLRFALHGWQRRQGLHERRDAYIRLAHQHMPTADVAVSLTQAELQIAHQQFEQALATLKHLRGLAPRHAYVLRLLAGLYQQLGDWEQLRKLLPELKKSKTDTPEKLARLEALVYRSLLADAAQSMEPSRLDSMWQKMPRSLHQEPDIVAEYVIRLHQRQRDEEAEQLLRGILKKHWSDQLVTLYGLLDVLEPPVALTRAERWLGERELDPALLLTLGRLSLRAQLWGKARSYLEAAIANGAGLPARRELGRLLDALGEGQAATAVYREAVLEQPGPPPVTLPEHIQSHNISAGKDRETVLPDLPEAVSEA